MSSIETLIDRYSQGWSHPNASVREALIRETLSPDATYTDPRADRLSVEQLLIHIGNVIAKRPGTVVLRTSNVDVHHNVARFNWHAVLPDGTSLPQGVDFIELDDGHRRIRRIVGFFGPLTRSDVASTAATE